MSQGRLMAEQGLQFTVSENFNLALCVNTNFAGLWTHEDDQDPVCVKSRTGHVVTLGDCPICFASKLQQEVATSRLKLECIALAAAMQAFVPLRHTCVELCQTFGFNLT